MTGSDVGSEVSALSGRGYRGIVADNLGGDHLRRSRRSRG